MFEYFSSDNIERDALSEEIAPLIAIYRNAAIDGQGADYNAFNIQTLDRFRNYLMVLAPVGENDFTYLYYGAEISRHADMQMTGKRLSTIGGDLASVISRAYVEALAIGKPVLTRHRALRSVSVSMWERLICPVQMTNGDRLLIVFNKPVEFRSDLLATILDAAPMGVMAFRAWRDGVGGMVDAKLVTVNHHAAQLVDRTQQDLIGQSIFDLIPAVVSRGIWDRYVSVVDTQETIHYDSRRNGEPDGPWLRLTVAPWNDGFIVMFTDITELKQALGQLEGQARQLRFEVGVEKASRSALSAQLQTAAERERALRDAVDRDSLTAILNRRGFDRAFAEMTEGGRGGVHLGLIDIDHFKAVNDQWGHAAGDEVLKAFAQRLSKTALLLDAATARLGGEEFAICVRIDDGVDPQSVFGEVQSAATADAFALGNGLAAPLTCSVGFVALANGEALASCIARADAALYEAKRFGRNRVSIGKSTPAAA